MKFLDIDRWDRKSHFHFFNQLEEPFWGVTLEMDCSKAYQKAKDTKVSFFVLYLYSSLHAANQIEEFKYRIDKQNRVIVHDIIHASSTINRPDGTFGFSYITYAKNFESFAQHAEKEIDRVKHSKEFVPALSSENVIHYSSLPWLSFTSLSHARSFSRNDSIPKISFGKLTKKDGKHMMPVSIHVHHGLIDGFHVGKYYELFQHVLNE